MAVQEERRVVEVLSALLKTYEAAAPEGAPGGSSPSRRASADLPAHSRSLQHVCALFLLRSLLLPL